MVEIAFERSGGFAGITLRSRLDLGEPTPAEAAALTLLQAMPSWGGLAQAVPGPDPGRERDQFCYRLTVTGSGSGRLVAFPEADLPDALRPLVERLTALAEGREDPGL